MDAEPPWVIEPVGRRHARDEFDCGNDDLNGFLRRYARQNEDLDLARTYVAVRAGSPRVEGYFTLRSGEIPLEALPEAARRRLPRYPVPVVHLARLAVDRTVQGRGLGGILLAAALEKALAVSTRIGALAVEVIATDGKAVEFYRHHGFSELTDDPHHLYLPMKRIAELFAPGGT